MHYKKAILLMRAKIYILIGMKEIHKKLSEWYLDLKPCLQGSDANQNNTKTFMRNFKKTNICTCTFAPSEARTHDPRNN